MKNKEKSRFLIFSFIKFTKSIKNILDDKIISNFYFLQKFRKFGIVLYTSLTLV